MSNLRRILPLLLCLSLLCACVQMPNAPKDETPLQSPLPGEQRRPSPDRHAGADHGARHGNRP